MFSTQVNKLMKTHTAMVRKPLIWITESQETSSGSIIISFSALFSLVSLQILPYYSKLINNQLRSLHAALGKYALVWHFDQFC